MNFKIYSFLLLVVLFSCKSNDNSTLRFAYYEQYKLYQSEKLLSLDKNIVDEYDNNLGFEQINVPLNKCVLGDKYKIFIGIAMENTAQDVVVALKADSKLKIIEIKDYKTNAKLFCKKNNKFSIRYLYTEKKEKLPIVFNVISDDSTLIKKLYDKNNILDKIK